MVPEAPSIPTCLFDRSPFFGDHPNSTASSFAFTCCSAAFCSQASSSSSSSSRTSAPSRFSAIGNRRTSLYPTSSGSSSSTSSMSARVQDSIYKTAAGGALASSESEESSAWTLFKSFSSTFDVFSGASANKRRVAASLFSSGSSSSGDAGNQAKHGDAEDMLLQEEFRALEQKEAQAPEVEGEEEEEEVEDDALSGEFLISYFVAGGAAGAASRTVVSPLERLKIIMQVQPHEPSSSSSSAKGGSAGNRAYSGVWSGLVKMWREEGMAGFMRGNGINCLRIAPYSAVQFSTYEILKRLLEDDAGELGVTQRLTAGALAGIASVVSTYPLDLVRSRISIASASMYAEAKSATLQATATAPQVQASTPIVATATAGSGATVSATASAEAIARSKAEAKEAQRKAAQALRQELAARQKKVPGIWETTVQVYKEEGGIRGLYRGCVPTSAGVAPYVAFNFYIYESLRYRLEDDNGEITTLQKLACGAGAGSISQTLTYPLDVLRRKMQVAGMKNSKLGSPDKTSIDVIRTIVRKEGVVGLYRGLWPNLLKVAPSIGVSFLTYETVRDLVEPHHGHHTHHHH